MLSQYFRDNIAQIKTLCNVAKEAADNIAQEKVLCSVVLIVLGQYSTGKTLSNAALKAGDNMTTLHKKNLFQCYLNFLRTTFHKVTEKTLCFVVQEAPDNIAREKSCSILIVLIILGQHCTGKNLVQCCPRGSRQHYT